MAEVKNDGDGQTPKLIPPQELPNEEDVESSKPSPKEEPAVENKSKPEPLVIENPEVKEKPETTLLAPEPESTLEKIMAVRRDLSFNDVPAMKMAKVLHEGFSNAAETPNKTDEVKPELKKSTEEPEQPKELNLGEALNLE